MFSILTICTGNLCRSPTLEQLLRLRLPSNFPEISLTVSSAGTHAPADRAMDSSALREAERLGAPDADQHRAQRLTQHHVMAADLVLGLAEEHRSAAVRLAPAANGRSFTLLEFAHVVSALTADELGLTTAASAAPGARLRQVVESAHNIRGMVASQAPINWDVVDPHRLEPAVYRASADAIDAAVTRILAALAGLERHGK